MGGWMKKIDKEKAWKMTFAEGEKFARCSEKDANSD